MSASCGGCRYPALECPCCCKQKAVLQGLINRVSGYECYLRTFTVQASCQNLNNATTFTNIVGGDNLNYRLRYVHDAVSKINLWPAVGCECSMSPYPITLHKTQGDCWGAVPVPGEDALVPFCEWLSSTYNTDGDFTTGGICLSVADLITETGKTTQTSLAALKGAIDWTTEIRKTYGSILATLPC